MVEEALEKRDEDEGRAVVFCRSRKRYKNLDSRLRCDVYHALMTGKSEKLESWIAGENKAIIATEALGTGVDISEIIDVIHVETI